MPNPGAKIQSKGLTILEDQLKHEFMAYKKAETYAESFDNMQFRNLAMELAQQHRGRYSRLFDYLNSHA